MQQKSNKYSGSILIGSLLIMFIVASIAMATLFRNKENTLMAINIESGNLAYQTADVGVEIVMADIIKGGHTLVSQLNNCDSATGLIIDTNKNYKIELMKSDDSTISCNGTAVIADVAKIKSTGNDFNRTQRTIVVKVPLVINATALAVATKAATNIAPTSVTVNANVSNLGGSDPDRLIQYGTSSGNYTASCDAGVGGVGDYSCNLTSLSSNTIYYFRAKATDSVGTAYGDEMSFATVIPAVAPTVATKAATNITSTSVTANANVSSTGGSNPDRLIQYGVSSGNYTASCDAGVGGVGDYSCNLTSLSSNTAYYFRAKATNYAGTSYGTEMSFTTVATAVCANAGDTVSGRSPDANTYKVITGDDGNCWLDRNLGATQVATSVSDAASYGWLYQWGRLTDGHQIASPLSIVTTTLSTTDVPGNAKIISAAASPNEWRSPVNYNLWQGVAGVNNPCPVGFRLPTKDEWTTEVLKAGITNYATAFSKSLLKLPSPGWRYYSTGMGATIPVYNAGSQGHYWSSTLNNPVSSPHFNFARFESTANVTSYWPSAYAQSVRCIKN